MKEIINFLKNKIEYYSGTPFQHNGKLKFRKIKKGTIIRIDKI